MLLYDGIHYDALAECPAPDAPKDFDVTGEAGQLCSLSLSWATWMHPANSMVTVAVCVVALRGVCNAMAAPCSVAALRCRIPIKGTYLATRHDDDACFCPRSPQCSPWVLASTGQLRLPRPSWRASGPRAGSRTSLASLCGAGAAGRGWWGRRRPWRMRQRQGTRSSRSTDDGACVTGASKRASKRASDGRVLLRGESGFAAGER